MEHGMQSEHLNIRGLLRRGEAFLVKSGVPNARKNAEWLLAHTLGCKATDLYLEGDKIPLAPQIVSYERLLARRGSREPLQYIIRSTEFMSLPILTVPGVFIPRPETERLVEIVEERVATIRSRTLRFLDLCCGSGAIVVSLLSRIGRAEGIAVDIDDAAVMLTEKNAALNDLDGRITCVNAEAADFLLATESKFDVVVCNPPYIPSEEIHALAPEVKAHEPIRSLDGGADGLDFYRRVIPLLRRCMTAGGIVGLEIGSGQGGIVSDILRRTGFRGVEIHADYGGHSRVVITRWPHDASAGIK